MNNSEWSYSMPPNTPPVLAPSYYRLRPESGRWWSADAFISGSDQDYRRAVVVLIRAQETRRIAVAALRAQEAGE
jgi:hypothetical protein